METRMAYCATCDRPVRVIVKKGGASGTDEVVCLEHGETCGQGTVCPIFDVPGEQMKDNLDAHRQAADW